MNDLLERQLAYERLLTDYTLMRAVAQYAVDNQNDPAEVARYAQAMMDEVDKAEGTR